MTAENLTAPSRYRGLIQGKTRVVVAWAFILPLLFSAREYPRWPGISLCFAGATLRFWASGYLRKDARPAVGGPYAWVRNPLYLGTYLMALGTALAVRNYWLLATATVVFAAIYHFIILDEETKLDRIFGAPYSRYRALVPRFLPSRLPPSAALLDEVNPDRSHRSFDWAIARRNRAYEAYLSFAGLIGLVTLIAALFRH